MFGERERELWIKSTHDEQRALDRRWTPDTFFVPPYVGPSGWVGVRIRDGRRRRAARARHRGVAAHGAEAARGTRSTRRRRSECCSIPCPWCGPRDEIEFRYGGQAGHRVPRRPRGPERRGVGRLPVHARQPARARSPSAGTTSPGAAGGSTWCGTRPRTRSCASYRIGEERPDDARDRLRRRAARDRPSRADRVHVRRRASSEGVRGRHARERAAGERRRRRGSAARSSAGPRASSRRASRSRTRSSRSREPWFDPIVAGDHGRRVDGLVAGAVPGVGRLPDGEHRATPRVDIGTCTSRRSSSAAGASGASRGRGGRRREGDRVLLVDEHGAIGSSDRRRRRLRTVGRPCLTNATALGVYDDGYVVVLERAGRRSTDSGTSGPARVVLATGAHRAADRVRRQRPARRDAGRGRGRLRRALRRRSPASAPWSSRRTSGRDVAASPDALARDRRRSWTSATDRSRRGRVGRERPRLGGRRDRGRPPASRRSTSRAATATEDDRCRPARWSRAAGTRTSRCGASIGGGLRYDDERRRASSRTAGPPWLSVVGRRGGRRARRRAPCWFVAERRRRRGTSSTSNATRRSPTSPRRVGARPALGRAREARHVHRHRDRPGPHERGPHRRDRERSCSARDPARRGRRTPGRRTRRSRSRRWPGRPRRPARPDPHARRSIRGTSTRGAAFENVGQWKRPWYFPRDGETMDAGGRARVPRGSERRRRDGRVDARQDRGGGARRGGVPRPHVHEPDVEPRRRARSATA